MLRNMILKGDCIEILKSLESKSIDLIFADPPYFMQTNGKLLRVEGSIFSGVVDKWDKFLNFKEYDEFCQNWLKECRRILKDNGTIWVIGSFHNIYRLGYIMQNLGFWVINDIIWEKPNPVPNFRGNRFCNAHESLLWCAKSKNSKYTFNYKTMKAINGNKQTKSIWEIGICIGNERIKDENGKKAHSTQKPEKLLKNIILSSSKPNDLILDPFFGMGTTGAIAKLLGRDYLGIEREEKYIKLAKNRIEKIELKEDIFNLRKLEIKPPKVSLMNLVENKTLKIGEIFYNKNGDVICTLCENNKVKANEEILSIHKMAAKIQNKSSCNGWNYFYIKQNNQLKSIDSLRWEFSKNKI